MIKITKAVLIDLTMDTAHQGAASTSNQVVKKKEHHEAELSQPPRDVQTDITMLIAAEANARCLVIIS